MKKKKEDTWDSRNKREQKLIFDFLLLQDCHNILPINFLGDLRKGISAFLFHNHHLIVIFIP